jgi:GPN-loop GTPase
LPSIFFNYFVGTAGAGKSLLTAALSEHLRKQEIAVATVNLDPGVVWLPYSPDVDARDYVNYDHVMRDFNLGPNGALVACIDLLISSIDSIRSEIEGLEPDYVIADTPGQLELFAFRATGNHLITSLGDGNSAISFVSDPNLARQASSLVSMLLLSASVQYRFLKPQLNVLAKSDLLNSEELAKVEGWFEEPSSLSKALEEESNGLNKELVERTFKMLEDLEQPSSLILTSASTGFGIDNLHAQLQRIFTGGEP